MGYLLSTTIKGWIGSLETFISGFAGEGWRIWNNYTDASGKKRWKASFDDLEVRGSFNIFELIVSKIRAIIGALGITQACGKIKEVTLLNGYYRIKVEDEMSFVQNDFIRYQRFSSDTLKQRSYWVKVFVVVNDEILIPYEEFTVGEIHTAPQVGDDIVQFGNETNTSRQSAIYIHADEDGAPAIDILYGVKSKSFEGCVKVKLGTFIDNNVSHVGLMCVNGLMKSVNEAGEEIYRINPDGSAFFAKGQVGVNSDGSGYIFKKTVDGVTKYGVHWDSVNGFVFGEDVKLSWNNLSADAQTNLKGDPGQKQPYYQYDFSNSTSITATGEPAGVTWTDAPPAAETNKYLWMRTTVFTPKEDNTGWNASAPSYTRLSGLNGSAAPQVRAQYSINGVDYWHIVFTTGDVYMRLSYDNGTSWTSAVRIVGEKGDPGNNGTSPYILDLTNDNSSLAATYDGVVSSDKFLTDSAKTDIQLYLGTSAVPDSGVTYSKGIVTGGTFTIIGKTCKIDSFTDDVATCEIVATISAVIVAKSRFTVTRVRGGKDGSDAVLYEIIPSVNTVKKDKGGVLSSNTIDFNVYSIVGSTRTLINSISGTVKMKILRNGVAVKIYDGSYNSGTGQTNPSTYPATIDVTGSTNEIQAVIYKNLPDGSWNESSIMDIETIPVLIDGDDGIDGNDGNDGKSIEFIFKRTTTFTVPSTPVTSQIDDYVPTGWTDNQTGVDSTNKYEWSSKRTKTNGVWSPFSTPALWAKYSLDGASPYTLDLTNENVSLPASSNGTVLDYSTAFTNFNLYLGDSVVTGSYSIVSSSGVTATLDIANKKITVTALTTDTGTVTLYAKNGDGSITYGTAVFTLSKVKNGESSVIYSLLPLVSVIKRDKDGVTTPISITCAKYKRVGSSDPVITSEMSLVYTTSLNSTETTYSGAVTIGAWTWIEFILKNGSVVLDRERVPVVKDGQDGADGTSPYQIILSNQMASIARKSDGTFDYTDAVTIPTLYYGINAIPNVTYAITSQSGVVASISNGTVSVTSVTNDYTNIEITATLQGGSVPVAKVLFKVIKSKSSAIYEIIPSVRVVKKNKDGVYSVSSVSFNVFKIEGSYRSQIHNVTDGVKMVIQRDGVNRVTIDGYGGNSSDFATAIVQVAPSGSPMTSSIVAKLYPSALGTWNDSDLLDMQTIPLIIDGVDGVDSNLLPWVEEWNSNQTEVGSDHLISPKIFSGTKDETTGALTGVALGREVVMINGVAKTGVFGLKNGVLTFFVDSETGDVSGDGKFSAGDSNGKIVLDPAKKSAVLYNSNGTIIGAFGFFQTNGSWDYSQAIMELYTYSGTTLVGKARISPSGMSLEKNGVTLFEAKAAPSDMGTHSIVNLNIPDDPNKVEVGQLYRNAGDGIVRVRLIP